MRAVFEEKTASWKVDLVRLRRTQSTHFSALAETLNAWSAEALDAASREEIVHLFAEMRRAIALTQTEWPLSLINDAASLEAYTQASRRTIEASSAFFAWMGRGDPIRALADISSLFAQSLCLGDRIVRPIDARPSGLRRVWRSERLDSAPPTHSSCRRLFAGGLDEGRDISGMRQHHGMAALDVRRTPGAWQTRATALSAARKASINPIEALSSARFHSGSPLASRAEISSVSATRAPLQHDTTRIEAASAATSRSALAKCDSKHFARPTGASIAA